MAVLLCPMIQARTAGVLFTRDPRTGYSRIHMEACPGGGQDLVGGRLSPHRLVLRRPDLAVMESNNLGILDCQTALALGELGLEAEGLFGSPQDIEWAHDGERAWLLQSRPITGLPNPSSVIVWTNANAGEALPKVMTPLTWSLMEETAVRIFESLLGGLGVDFRQGRLISCIAGRPYFNLNTLHLVVSQTLWFGDGELRQFLGGLHELPEPTGSPPWWKRLRTLARLLRLGLGSWANTPARGRIFLECQKRQADIFDKLALHQLDDAQLRGQLRELRGQGQVMATGVSATGTGLGASFLLFALCRRWLGKSTDANRLLAGWGGMDSAKPVEELWRLAREARSRPPVRALLEEHLEYVLLRQRLQEVGPDWLALWDAFVERHGHHACGEIELTPHTDAGWTVNFVTAAAVVTDLGGLLSHGAIIARECGIPAVVNVGTASSVIRTGQWIEVDGDRGLVRTLETG